jgi:hypothetical protein
MPDEPLPQPLIPTVPPIGAPTPQEYGSRVLTPQYDLSTLPSVATGRALTSSHPVVQKWMTEAMKDYGLTDYQRELNDYGPTAISAMMARHAMRTSPPIVPPTEGTVPIEDYKVAPLDTDLWRALQHGLGESPFGALRRWSAIRAAGGWENDPTYDPWKDPDIKNAGLQRQIPELFAGSQSNAQSRWIMQRKREKERESDVINRMGVGADIAEFGGGLLGDPLTYLPTTLGVRAARLAGRARMGLLTGDELAAFASRNPIYGGIADGLRTAGVAGAMLVAERSMEASVDPTATVDGLGSELAVTMALSGSIGLLMGSFGRFSNRGLIREVMSENFLSGTKPSGARWVDPDFVGPIVPPDPAQRVFMVSKHDDLTRRMERVEYDIPDRTRKKIARSETLTDAEEETLRRGIESMGLKIPKGIRPSEFLSLGKRKAPDVVTELDNGPSNGGAFDKGSLATSYGLTRQLEVMTDPAYVHLPRERADFRAWWSTNKLVPPGGVPGQVFQVYHGTTTTYDIMSDAMLGATTGAPSAYKAHFFAGNPETASTGYAGHRQETVWVDKNAPTSWLKKSLFGENVRKVMTQVDVAPPGGQIRPTYIRMENPYIVRDSDRITLQGGTDAAHWLGKGANHIVDVDGNSQWLYNGRWYDSNEVSIQNLKVADAIKDMNPEEQMWWRRNHHLSSYAEEYAEYAPRPDAVGHEEITVPTGGRRAIRYSIELDKAKALGHDGVVFQDTFDGGNGRDSIYAVFSTDNVRYHDQRWHPSSQLLQMPAVPAGMTRLYHVGAPPKAEDWVTIGKRTPEEIAKRRAEVMATDARWYSDDPSVAKWHRGQGDDVTYIDVPKDSVAAMKANDNNTDGILNLAVSWFAHDRHELYYLPESLARQAKSAEQKMAAAPSHVVPDLEPAPVPQQKPDSIFHTVLSKNRGVQEMDPARVTPGSYVAGSESQIVIVPDGRVWGMKYELLKQLPSGVDKNAVTPHEAFFAVYPELDNQTIRLTVENDRITGSMPTGTLTEEQRATLRQLEGNWSKRGLDEKFEVEMPREAPVSERTGLGQPAAEPPETPAFQAFSQGNKLFEMRGGPFLAYHGTGRYFDEFSDAMRGSATRTGDARMGHFLASTPDAAGTYSGWEYGFEEGRAPQIRPAYVRMTNPLLVTSANVGEITGTAAHKLGTDDYAAVIKAAKAGGHDGVIFRRDPGSAKYDSDHYFVFDAKDQIRHFDQRYDVGGPEAPGSVGAALSPQSQVYQAEVQLAQGRMAPTGLGLEHLPLDPVARAFMGSSVEAQKLLADLVSTGGRITVGNKQGIAALAPVEVLIHQRWNKPMVDAVRSLHDEYAAYRMALAGPSTDPANQAPTSAQFSGRSDWNRIGSEIGNMVKDRFAKGEKPMSMSQFRLRVGGAIDNLDEDLLTDGATPYVNSAAKQQRKLYDKVKQEALDSGVFDEAYEKAKHRAQAGVEAVKREADDIAKRANIERWPADRQRAAEEALLARQEDAEFRYQQTVKQLDQLRQYGPSMNGTAPSFRPRLWNVYALQQGEQRFMDITTGWLMSKSIGITDIQEAARVAKQMHEILSKQMPVYERADIHRLFQSVASPHSAQARTFTIPNALVQEFLEQDAETLIRYHVKDMGAKIEMMKRFGSTDLADEIAGIEREYRNLITAANAGATEATPEAKRLASEMKQSIYDAQAVRDKIYGTYGAAADPHRWQSRLIRMAKQYSNLTLLGMSGVTALGDLIRPLMTEGLEAMYGYGFRTLMSDQRSTILRMSRQELELAGDAMELMNNVRALHAADSGDVFTSRGTFEHGLTQANSWFFVANGLNAVNQLDKEWAGVIIQGRINKILKSMSPAQPGGRLNQAYALLSDDELVSLRTSAEKKLAKRQGQRLSEIERAQTLRDEITSYELELQVREASVSSATGIPLEDVGRFAAAGIDQAMARRIGIQLRKHGEDFKSITMANTEAWTDDVARDTYRSALYQMVNRTVPTPGIGDRANWMSTELGGLVSQYKSFAVGSMVRGLYSGLQEGGNRFWYGAAASVGFAMVLNEIRSRLMYDKSTFDRPPTAVLADAIDRSSILGWFSDANRAIEVLTGHRAGVRPLLGAEKPHWDDSAKFAGTFGGPAVGQGFRASGVLNEFLSGHPTARTFAEWRQLWPGGNHPVLDPVFDRVISDGSWYPPKPPQDEPKPGRKRQPKAGE